MTFWGPQMLRLIDEAGKRGIATNTPPSVFARAAYKALVNKNMPEAMGMLHPEIFAERTLKDAGLQIEREIC